MESTGVYWKPIFNVMGGDFERELGDLNRTRRKLFGMMTSEKNRLIKVLETANIKLSSVVLKDLWRVFIGYDPMSIGEGLIFQRGYISKWLKESSERKLDLLEKALNGKITDHHRFLLKMHLQNTTIFPSKSR